MCLAESRTTLLSGKSQAISTRVTTAAILCQNRCRSSISYQEDPFRTKATCTQNPATKVRAAMLHRVNKNGTNLQQQPRIKHLTLFLRDPAAVRAADLIFTKVEPISRKSLRTSLTFMKFQVKMNIKATKPQCINV
jgi:hypothetical protein